MSVQHKHTYETKAKLIPKLSTKPLVNYVRSIYIPFSLCVLSFITSLWEESSKNTRVSRHDKHVDILKSSKLIP